jgi:nucleotide-binding universal stress UspA family protein
LSLRTQVVLADGDPAPQLVERAEQLSLLVTGSRGYGPVRRAVLGGVSAQVLRALPCPVLVVPRGVGEVHRAAA